MWPVCYMMTGLNWASAAHRTCINVTDVKDPGEHLEQCYATFKRNLPAAMEQQRNEAMLFALASIPVAWVLVYLSLGVVRWVRRGF